jgi:tetratricopeptide (TPR) repeat protein
MKQKLFCILFLFLQFSYAQSPTSIEILKKERQIKKTLTSQPDSARIYIEQILNYKGKLHDTVYSNAYMAYGYYHNLRNSTDSSLYCYDKALTYANGTKYPRQYARLLRNKANTYKKRSDFKEALALLAIAEEKYRSVNDQEGLAVIYGDIASNYNLMLKSADAITYLLKSIAILEKTDNEYIYSVKLSLANTYMATGNYEFASDLYKEVLKGFKDRDIQKNYSLTLINYGDCLTRMKDYAGAEKTIAAAIPGLKKFNDHELIAVAYAKMGRIEMEQKKYSQAESYYKTAFEKAVAYNSVRTVSIASEYIETLNSLKKYPEAISIINRVEELSAIGKANLADKANFEGEKTTVYQNMHHDEKAAVAIENKQQLTDTLNKEDKTITTVALQQEYQSNYQDKKTESLKHINTSLKERLTANNRLKIIPILSLGIILIIVAVAYRRKCKKHHKKLSQVNNNMDLMIREYENNKQLNTAHKKNIENKQSELYSNIVLLTTLEGNIGRLIATCGENGQDMDIESIKGELQSLISDKDYWKLFRKRFNETYVHFQ